jgi:lipoate-protein ligase A
MEKWRLLLHPPQDAYTNMAIDEILLRAETPTLRFYQWSPSAISIGYFQSIHDEVDLESCRTINVDVVRRITGGGAVYHDTHGEITYSITAPLHLIPPNIQKSYEYLCGGLVKGLQILGIPAKFFPINDIQVNKKKISGSAQTRRFGHVLQHGTLLCSLDPNLMFSLLRVTKEKLKDKYIKNVKDRVTSIEHILGTMDKKTLLDAMIQGFSEALSTDFHKDNLTGDENALIPIIRKKYDTREWNFKR